MTDDLHTDIARLLAKAGAAHKKFEAEVAAAPPSRSCAKHASVAATFDREETYRSGKITYWCPECSREQELERIRAQQARIGVPRDVWHATFENFDYGMVTGHDKSNSPIDFLRGATDLAAGKIRNLILAGTPGIGKGHLAASVINAAIAQRRVWPYGEKRTAKWTALHAVFAAAHKSYDHPEGIAPVCRTFARYDLLVLDEVGMTPMPKDGSEILWEIVNGRYLAQKLTIMLSGMKGGELRTFLGDPIIDRLKGGGLRFLWGTWQSGRLTKSEDPTVL